MSGNVIGEINLIDSKIEFPEGFSNNYVVCDNTEGVVLLEKCNITFKGDNNVVYLEGGNKKSYKFKIVVSNGSSIYIGKDTLFHKSANVHIVSSENAHIVIGRECMIANNVWIRTGDAHPIYSTKTHEKINHAKNVIIGDHVWLTQDCIVLKGTIAGSGGIFGAKSLLTNKHYYSNTSYAGSPARILSEEGAVFFDKLESNLASKEKLQQYERFDSDKFIYTYDKNTSIIETLCNYLVGEKDPLELIEFYKNMSRGKNRFALSSSAETEGSAKQ